jgi:hypothetical protein
MISWTFARFRSAARHRPRPSTPCAAQRTIDGSSHTPARVTDGNGSSPSCRGWVARRSHVPLQVPPATSCRAGACRRRWLPCRRQLHAAACWCDPLQPAREHLGMLVRPFEGMQHDHKRRDVVDSTVCMPGIAPIHPCGTVTGHPAPRVDCRCNHCPFSIPKPCCACTPPMTVHQCPVPFGPSSACCTHAPMHRSPS